MSGEWLFRTWKYLIILIESFLIYEHKRRMQPTLTDTTAWPQNMGNTKHNINLTVPWYASVSCTTQWSASCNADKWCRRRDILSSDDPSFALRQSTSKAAAAASDSPQMWTDQQSRLSHQCTKDFVPRRRFRAQDGKPAQHTRRDRMDQTQDRMAT